MAAKMHLIRNHTSLILFAFCANAMLFAQDPVLLFEEANRIYAQGDYQSAVDLYLKIIEQGVESGEVYFNLGNAYYKLDQIGFSILYYEKAKKYIEGDPALEQNLALARLKIVDKIDSIPKIFIEEWWYEVLHFTSINTMLWISFSLFTLSVLLLIIQILYNRPIFRRVMWILISIFLIIALLSVSRIYEFETSEFGVILEEKVSVFSEPGLGGTEVFILHEGTKVSINRGLDDWYEISIPDGKTGWLRSNTLETI